MSKHDYSIPIRISGLTEGVHQFEVLAKPAILGLPDEFDADLRLDIELDKTHSQIVMHVRLQSQAVFPCDRCLAPVTIPIDATFILFYARDLTAARMLDEDDVRIIDPQTPVVDIAEDVREYALLSIPMKRTCADASDGTMRCSANFTEYMIQEPAVDPRWEKLRQWNKFRTQ